MAAVWAPVLGGILVGMSLFGSGGRIDRYLHGVKPGVTLEGRGVAGLLPVEVKSKLQSAKAALDLPPQDADLRQSDGAVLPERPGRSLDVAATLEQVMEAGKNQQVSYVFRTLPSRFTVGDLRRLQVPIAYYATWIHGGPGRVYNIILAAKILNRRIIWPGTYFSFNQVTGPHTRERGWKEAPIISGNAFIPGYGGGVCQVSSTLYNVVLGAKLEVIERHPHSEPVHYVPKGRDAAVADGSLDFRFRNNLSRPVILLATVRNYQLQMTFQGDPRDLPAGSPRAGLDKGGAGNVR